MSTEEETEVTKAPEKTAPIDVPAEETEVVLPKEGLFKLTCRDRSDSPNYTFTWEMTLKGLAELQANKILRPFMYVFATEWIPPKSPRPHGQCGCEFCVGCTKVVASEIYCLHEGSGQIQFNRPGKFKIYAMVVWADCSSWRKCRNHILYREESLTSIVTEGYFFPDSALKHVETYAIEVGTSFFAKKANPKLWWWANLWWDSPPKNSCKYKQRVWFVLWLQLLTVPIWAGLRFLVGFLYALALLLVAVRWKYVHLLPLVHPFRDDLSEVCSDETADRNWAASDSNGKERSVAAGIALFPLSWVGAGAATYGLYIAFFHHLKGTLWFIGLALLGLLMGFLVNFIVKTFMAKFSKNEKYLSYIPVEEPKPKEYVSYRVRWLDLKGKLCLPYAK